VFEFRVNRKPKQIAAFDDRADEAAAVRRGITDGDVRTPRDLLGALDDLDIELETASRGDS
jgi:hypothetical protein